MGSYPFPNVEPEWCATRETHPAIGAAIHAIAYDGRDAHAIWSDPTAEELNRISMAIKEYVRQGLVEPAPRGLYVWGTEVVVVESAD